MALRFYNTLSQQLEEFKPREDNIVRMYTCGPTVYDYAHIGNFRTFTFYDLLRRWLRARGYRLDHVMNITDVEDKIIRNALAQKKSLGDYTTTYEKAFLNDCESLRLEPPERWARATEHIDEMANAIGKLTEKGCTYSTEGSVYFRISSFPDYGKLSHNDFSAIRAGARVDVDTYDKADARDFVLWKAPKDGDPFWETPLGPGRPGWHIECSVMAIRYLGDTLDIHAGGVDLIFPHHENEIAQSVSLTGKPFAQYWLHSEFLLVDGQKMSKSAGNFYTLRDVLEQGYPAETVRYLLASVPHRKQLNFTFDGLKSAATAVERLRNFKLRLDKERFPAGKDERLSARIAQAETQFGESLDDDLNTAEALAAVFEYIREANIAMDAGEFREENAVPARAFLERFDAIFDVLRPSAHAGSISDAEVEARIAARTQAKKARNFAEADRLRDELLTEGIILEDTKDGIRWKRK
jgi:cysteinyl-tRNA synthetase